MAYCGWGGTNGKDPIFFSSGFKKTWDFSAAMGWHSLKLFSYTVKFKYNAQPKSGIKRPYSTQTAHEKTLDQSKRSIWF